MGLFFISVGSQFDWAIIISEPLAVIILTLGLVFGKGIAIMFITRWAGFEKGVAIRAGIVLGQGSEFGFALLALSLSTGLLEVELSQPIIAAIIISMAVSPMLIRKNEAIANRLAPDYVSHRRKTEQDIEQASESLKDHVILCGFGRIGQNLAGFLKRVNIPFIALELNTELITKAWEAGEPVYYGDSSRAETLLHAGILTAKALVISFPDVKTSEHISREVKRLRSDLPLIVRTRDDRHLEQLLESGADEVIPDTLESSMMLAKHTLSKLGLAQSAIDDMLVDAREGQYARIRAFFHSAEDEVDVNNPDHHHLHSIEVLKDSYANGKTIESFKCLPKINIVALRRNGIRTEGPLLNTPLKSGDLLVVEGRPDDIRCAEIEVMSGR
jgi:CPA2 family monovalent cation:H+ antiporter-2